MKRIITPAIILLVVACLAGACSSWREVTVRITEQDLRERLGKKFPVTKDYKFIGTVTYANPRITLRREDNRVELGLDIIMGDAGRSDSIRGVADMLVSVVYDQKKKAVYLARPELQRFAVNGMPEQNIQLLSALFMPAIEKMLERNPVYRLKPKGATKKIASMLVKDIRVREGCLEIVYGV